jgi:hypothetical protein
MIRPVDSKGGHKRTSSHYLTFVNPTPLALRVIINDDVRKIF